MRFAVAFSLLLAAPAVAQDADPGLGRRVGKLESEMKAVQRKVFPGGDARFFEPEVAPAAPAPAETVGTPASAPLTDLTARVGELEAQLRTLTGQVEADQNRIRLLEEGLAKFRGDAEFRLNAIEAGTRPPAPATAAPVEEPAAGPLKPATPAAPLTVEGQWRAAYALVVAKDEGAADALTEFVAANPKAARASDALYWLGKTRSTQKQYAAAARAFLDGYTTYPRGTRAPDSLLGLAQALIDLKKPDQACRSLTQLDEGYGAKLSPALKAQAAKARVTAKCAA
ncbi:hypothetical protein FMM06_00630 [Glacieibacterium frigidum]|uniref:Cell division coordinator CpoB n=1 Tax=Glacieibacterium frigidum TaxID=2593303 RepID=A0A552UJA2_9SPHN|nr:hypothetical protein FMM06_00630 [Glacieibacterium frigidum]